MKFSSMEELKSTFLEGNLTELPDTITIEYVHPKSEQHLISVYERGQCNQQNIIEQINSNAETYLVYAQLDEYDGADARLIFEWKRSAKLATITPSDVKLTDVSKLTTPTCIEEQDRAVIGNVIELKFPDLSEDSFESKVDTGAGQCCFHADNIKDGGGGSITFEIGSRRITMNKSGDVEIQTADNGQESRPVVKLNVQYDGKNYSGVEFNLNDRGDMPHPVLLGQNFLRAGNFLIDPLIEEYSPEYFEAIKRLFEEDTK